MKKLIPILLAVFALASCEKDPDMGKLDDNYLVQGRRIIFFTIFSFVISLLYY